MQKRFITISKARRILGKNANNLSDQQLQEVIDTLYDFAEFSYHNWIEQQAHQER